MLKCENQMINQAYFEEHLFDKHIVYLDFFAPTNKTTELWSQIYAFKNDLQGHIIGKYASE